MIIFFQLLSFYDYFFNELCRFFFIPRDIVSLIIYFTTSLTIYHCDKISFLNNLTPKHLYTYRFQFCTHNNISSDSMPFPFSPITVIIRSWDLKSGKIYFIAYLGQLNIRRISDWSNLWEIYLHPRRASSYRHKTWYPLDVRIWRPLGS